MMVLAMVDSARADVHADGRPVGRRFLQGFELAIEQGGRHEVAVAGGQARGDGCLGAGAR